jgi:hypothetical protein
MRWLGMTSGISRAKQTAVQQLEALKERPESQKIDRLLNYRATAGFLPPDAVVQAAIGGVQ